MFATMLPLLWSTIMHLMPLQLSLLSLLLLLKLLKLTTGAPIMTLSRLYAHCRVNKYLFDKQGTYQIDLYRSSLSTFLLSPSLSRNLSTAGRASWLKGLIFTPSRSKDVLFRVIFATRLYMGTTNYAESCRHSR